MSATGREEWEAYKSRELQEIHPLLDGLGIVLDEEQVHLGGERYLMAGARDVGGGGKKLVLMGTRRVDNKRVVIKVSSDPAGMQEIERERECRQALIGLSFALWTFNVPEELLFERRETYVLFITAYIAQETPLLARPLDEQFFMVLRAFETQEGVHVTTSQHAATIRNAFGIAGVKEYLASFETCRARALEADHDNSHMAETLRRAHEFLYAHKTTIERYCGFLTHADFVPNNLRVEDHTLYLLDYASLHFGNKYEGWARFVNFMVHHHPALEQALIGYVSTNRSTDEYLCLRLMRAYKLAFLLQFYTGALAHTTGDLHTLVRLRIDFWVRVLECVLDDTQLPPAKIKLFVQEEAHLRSSDEKARQRELIGTRVGGI